MNPFGRKVVACGTLALLAGCAAPHLPATVAPRDAAALGLAGPVAPAIDGMWWRALGDPQLDRIVTDALAGSPTLEAGFARVRQAGAVLDQRRGEGGPAVSADVEPQISRLSGRYIIPPPYGGTVRFVGTATASLSWNLDLFGRQRSAIRAARDTVRAAALDAEAARLMLAGSVVQTYLELARAERQAAIADRTIATREGTVRLVQARVRNQLASQLDTTAATTLLAQARQARAAAASGAALARNALAALAGRGADYPATIAATALRSPDGLALPAAIPADLLARRADIAAARARIDAAGQGVEAARRAYYPDVNLRAMAGLQAIGLGNIVSLDAGTASAGPALHLPIFESGQLRAGLAGATAALDLATADYNGSVVTAVREAADALARIGALAQQRARSREVVQGFTRTGRLNQVRVASGLDSRLDLIDNDVRLLDAELTDADLATDAAIARVQLVQALGGGFAPSQDSMK